MPTVPWPAIEANPKVYVDPSVLSCARLRSPAEMEIHEVWAWIAHIQRLQQGKGPAQFSFRPRDDIVRRLNAQTDSGLTR